MILSISALILNLIVVVSSARLGPLQTYIILDFVLTTQQRKPYPAQRSNPMTEIKQGHYIKLEGLTKEQHTKACRAFVDAGAYPYENENYPRWREFEYLGWETIRGMLMHHSFENYSRRKSATLITYEQLVGELKPCPFCGGEAFIHSNRDWHSIKANHIEDCILGNSDIPLSYANSTGQIELLVSDWNTRTSPEVGEGGSLLRELMSAKPLDALGVDCRVSRDSANEAIILIQSQQAEIERFRSRDKEYEALLITTSEAVGILDQKCDLLQARVKEFEGVLEDAKHLITVLVDAGVYKIVNTDTIVSVEETQEAIGQVLDGTEEVSPWKPIESVPKDGSVIEAWHHIHKCWVPIFYKKANEGFDHEDWIEKTLCSSWPIEAFEYWRFPLPPSPEDE